MAPRADTRRRVVIVSGIYPPDIGGPATHAFDLRRELLERGHRVCVVTLGDGRRVERDRGVVRIPRRWPWPLRHAAVVAWLVDRAHLYDVVYATGMLPSAVGGARTAGKPVVVKVVGDPVWERGRRLGLTDGEFEAFQHERGGPLRMRAMRALRNRTLRAASVVTAPSEFLAATVDRWLAGPSGVEVIPNGVRAPVTSEAEQTSDVRAIYVGRLVPHKRVDELIRAVATDARLRLDVVGGGPDLDRLRGVADATVVGDRVRFLGPLAHDDVLSSIARADALVLASDYEGLPHVVLEALACGTPVVSVPVGGVEEVVEDGRSGLIVAMPQAIGPALTRLADDDPLHRTLREGAAAAGERWSSAATADGVEAALDRAAGTPRIVLLGKTHASDPPTPGDLRKRAVVVKVCDPVFVNVGTPGIRRVGRTTTLVLPDLPGAAGLAFYAVGPLVAVAAAAGRRRSAVVCQSPFEAVGVQRIVRLLPRGLRPAVVVELHGDPASAATLYGGSVRGFLAKPAARVAQRVLRDADGVRAVSRSTASFAQRAGPLPSPFLFPAWTDIGPFLAVPPVDAPPEPRAIFVGALEASKGIDVLIDAWPHVVRKVPEARLTVVGAGALGSRVRDRIRADGVDASVRMLGALPHERIADALDDARVLIVPSRTEGLGRVLLEAAARGRPVVASEVGGIPELVSEGETGVLVPPEDPQALSVAIVELLDDRAASEAMGDRARARVEREDPDRAFAAGFAELAAWVASR